MSEVVSPVLPGRFNSETGYLDYVTTDPSIGLWSVPAGFVARLHYVAGFYSDDAGPSRMEVNLLLRTGLEEGQGVSPVYVYPTMPAIVGGNAWFVWSREITTWQNVQHQPGSSFNMTCYAPLPKVTLYPGGGFQVDYNHATRNEPDQAVVELFTVEGKGDTANANADLYLLPALG